MSLNSIVGFGSKIIASVIVAGVFYSVWLGVFILTTNVDNPLWEAIKWLAAPVITAAGFATGILVFGRLIRTSKTNFRQSFVWALVGCAIGAGAVYWFGPMLIVFGMFIAGTASIILHELLNGRP